MAKEENSDARKLIDEYDQKRMRPSAEDLARAIFRRADR